MTISQLKLPGEADTNFGDSGGKNLAAGFKAVRNARGRQGVAILDSRKNRIVVLVVFASNGCSQVAIGEYAYRQLRTGKSKRESETGVNAGGILIKGLQLIAEFGGLALSFRLVQVVDSPFKVINGVLNIVHLIKGFLFIGGPRVHRWQNQPEIIVPAMMIRSHHRWVVRWRR